MTKQSGYATKQTGYFWTKQLGLNTEDIKAYLEKQWYKGHCDVAWYDTHKSDQMTYYGYWSNETAAAVKILGIDDSCLKNQQYYPYDLAHFKKEP